MALRILRFALVAFSLLILLATPSAIYSCGPFLESAIFVFMTVQTAPGELRRWQAWDRAARIPPSLLGCRLPLLFWTVAHR